MQKLKLQSLEEIKQQYRPIRNANIRTKEELSRINKFALWITNRVGSMGFFFIIFLWTITWLSWNTLAPHQLKFDPYPAFVLWLFISNMIQIFLMPLIMIGQNLQSKHSEIRAEEDFLINKKAETEVETILIHLENQNELILKILERLPQSDAKS
ncbi:MAG: DUF1003 domain-containing protein [Chitinophagales bacterium]